MNYNNIVEIYDENNKIVKFHKLDIKYEKTKRSSVFTNILYIDDIPIIGNKRNKYKVKFLCDYGNYSIVALKFFLSKKDIHCNKCSNRNHVHHYIYFQKKIENDFNEYNNKFKIKYWDRHLHQYEFDKYLNYIVTINHKTFDKHKIKYYEHLRSNNQSLFQSYISFDGNINTSKEPVKSIELKCNICHNIFSIHPFNLRNININDIRCRKCNFSKMSFKSKLYKNTLLTYQSKLEERFLDYCYNYGIKVMNGFEIPY